MYNIRIRFRVPDEKALFTAEYDGRDIGYGEEDTIENATYVAKSMCRSHFFAEEKKLRDARLKVGISYNEELTADEFGFIQTGDAIGFIRSFRNRSGFGLADSKAIYDGLREYNLKIKTP